MKIKKITNTSLKLATCLGILHLSIFITTFIKKSYHRSTAIRYSQQVFEDTQLTNAAPAIVRLNHSPAHSDRVITVNLETDLNEAVPVYLQGKLRKILNYMGITVGSVRVYYTDNRIQFVGEVGDQGYKRVAIPYKGAWYNGSGAQIDKIYKLPAYTDLVVSSRARFSSKYGYRFHPVLKRMIFHSGVDVAAPIGSKILAALPGTVKKIGYMRGYGNYMILKHQDELESFYGHLYAINRSIQVGQTVSQMEHIAFVGKTGVATGPHLHFEMRKNGKAYNPILTKPIRIKLTGQELRDVKNVLYRYNKTFHIGIQVAQSHELVKLDLPQADNYLSYLERPQVKSARRPKKMPNISKMPTNKISSFTIPPVAARLLA